MFDLIGDMKAGLRSDIRYLHRKCEGLWRSITFTALTCCLFSIMKTCLLMNLLKLL